MELAARDEPTTPSAGGLFGATETSSWRTRDVTREAIGAASDTEPDSGVDAELVDLPAELLGQLQSTPLTDVFRRCAASSRSSMPGGFGTALVLCPPQAWHLQQAFERRDVPAPLRDTGRVVMRMDAVFGHPLSPNSVDFEVRFPFSPMQAIAVVLARLEAADAALAETTS